MITKKIEAKVETKVEPKTIEMVEVKAIGDGRINYGTRKAKEFKTGDVFKMPKEIFDKHPRKIILNKGGKQR